MGVRKLMVTVLGYGALAAVFLACASPALADDPYTNFAKCPTGAPEMNDPSIEGAVCVSGLAREGSFKVGNFQTQLASPMHLQFGFVIKESEEWLVVPGGTSLEVESFSLPNPFLAPAASGLSPVGTPAPKQTKKRQRKRHRCAKHQKRKHGKQRRCGKHRKHRKKKTQPQPSPVVTPPVPAGPNLMKATLEPAGDVRKVNPAAIFGEPEPLFELPLKVHLEGAELGPACFIGTDAEPIVLTPLQVTPPTEFSFGEDPNGFKVEMLSLGGGKIEDTSFSVGGASGCGPEGGLDGQINALLGLPASAGASQAVMGNMLLQFAAAINDKTPPESGEELQAAFEAAQ
ncbi:MAG TPA: hypothetical protein VFN18_12085 [Solirubrobacterales bacterium]|nr:hypothetical protein [Solirubrobacterales bacterium]